MSITRRGAFGAAALAAALAVGLTGCSSSGSLTGGSSGSPSAVPSGSSSTASKTLVVGSQGFAENELLGYIYGGALADKGYSVTYKPGVGERSALVTALKQGSIDLEPDYAGSLLNFLDSSATAKSSADVKSALDAKVASIGAVAYDFAPAADADSVTVTSAFSKKYGVTSIGDLKKVSSVTLAANQNFATRPDGLKGLKSVYGLSNITLKAINDYGGPTTLKALLDGDVQAADIFTSTPSIAQNHLVVLKDPKNLFASQQVVPIVAKADASTAVGDILNAVSAKLTTSGLIALNAKTTGASKEDPQAVAKAWLAANGF